VLKKNKDLGIFTQHQCKETDMKAADSSMDSINRGQIFSKKCYLNP